MQLLFVLDRVNLDLFKGDSVNARQILNGLSETGNKVQTIAHGKNSFALIHSPADFSLYQRVFSSPLASHYTIKALKKLLKSQKFDALIVKTLICPLGEELWFKLPSFIKTDDTAYYLALRRLSGKNSLPLIYIIDGISEKNTFPGLCGGSTREIHLKQLSLSQGIICLSKVQANLLKKEGIEKDFFVLPASCDTKRFHPKAKSAVLRIAKKFHLNSSKFNLLYLSSTADESDLIPFWKILSQADSNIEMIINAIATEKLEDKIKKLGLDERVHFVGRIAENDKIDLINFCSAGIYLKKFNMPIADASTMMKVSEYLACGKPVLHPKMSGLAEQCGSAGIIFDENIEASAKKLNELSKNKKLQQKLSAIARKRALDYCNLKKNVKELNKFLLGKVRK